MLLNYQQQHSFNGPVSGTTQVSQYQKGTRGSAMAKGPCCTLVSRNSATTKHSIWKL